MTRGSMIGRWQLWRGGNRREGGRGEGILVGATQGLKAVATEVPACKGELNNCNNIKNRTKIALWLNLIWKNWTPFCLWVGIYYRVCLSLILSRTCHLVLWRDLIRSGSHPIYLFQMQASKFWTHLWLHRLLNCISATTRIKFRECFRDGSTIEVLSCAPLTHAVGRILPPDPCYVEELWGGEASRILLKSDAVEKEQQSKNFALLASSVCIYWFCLP